jgi:uracil-DNA glycosylase family 4
MGHFVSLIEPGISIPVQAKVKKSVKEERGCESCPLNEVDGINKIFGEVTGKKLAIFAQSPGPEENIKGRELIGPSGRWWWTELKRVGFSRDDVDIQNVVRCLPADEGEDGSLKMRGPTPKEIRCCSLHTENILPKLKARYILVLGQVAAKALLNTRSLPSQRIFWDKRLEARIYLLDHPAFFLRGGSPSRLAAFRQTLDIFKKDVAEDSGGVIDPYAFIRRQDYRLVLNLEQAEEAVSLLCGQRRVLAVDIEDDDVEGKRRVIACGFCGVPGQAFTFVFYHKDQSRKDGEQVKAVAKTILEDPAVQQCYHYGCSDVVKLWEYERIWVTPQSYVHDTNVSEYFRFPDARKYGLASIAENRFPQFSGYKNIILPELLSYGEIPGAIERGTPEQQSKYLSKNDLYHLSRLSLDTLRLYNGGDCHLTKKIYLDNRKREQVPQALLGLYIDLSFILHTMESNGPLFDYEQFSKLNVLYPKKGELLCTELRAAINDDKFNPASPTQVYTALYKTLKLEFPLPGKPNTQKAAMQMLAQRHTFPAKVLEWRHLAKADGTYIKGYKACADLHEGRLRTRWWYSGTRSGRLSSGGGREKESGVVNLQNVANNEHIQNMLIADKDWQRVYNLVWQILGRFAPDLVNFWVVEDTYTTAAAKAKKTGEKFAGDKPMMSEALQATYTLAAKKVEAWLRKMMPDFRVFLMLDYGQIEVRVAAQLSGDENLIADCQESDIHTRVGSIMTGWDPEKIRHDKYTRTRTKNVHFGVLFGQSEEGTVKYVISMAPPEEQLKVFNMSDKERRKYENEIRKQYRRYFERYTGIKDFIENQREFARQNGYVETIFGMQRPLDIREDRQEEAEIVDDGGDKGGGYWGNIAINSTVQGSAHQLLVCGLVNVRRQPAKYEVLGTPVMDVHDALYFNVRALDLMAAYKKARYLMEQESLNTVKTDFPHIEWRVPIATEAEAGLSLGCKLELTEETTTGSFLIDWVRKRRKQLEDLDREMWKVVGTGSPVTA